MSSIHRLLIIALAAGAVAWSATAWAGACCEAAADKARKGETCAKCEEHECCKKACEKVKEAGEAKDCQKCAAKKDEPKG